MRAWFLSVLFSAQQNGATRGSAKGIGCKKRPMDVFFAASMHESASRRGRVRGTQQAAGTLSEKQSPGFRATGVGSAAYALAEVGAVAPAFLSSDGSPAKAPRGEASQYSFGSFAAEAKRNSLSRVTTC